MTDNYQNINVIDPLSNSIFNASLTCTNNNYQISKVQESIDENTNLYASPGWIDIHTHIYDGFTQLSVPPDEIGLKKGVHILADAGSAGEATIDGLRKYLLPIARTNIKSWLNISSIGLVHLKEGSHINYLNPELTIKAVEANRDFVCGIKVRASGHIVGSMDLQSLKLAKLVARETNLPLMVHIGETPPLIEEVLDLLSEGDVITHCYHGKLGKPWLSDGKPINALKTALERGVKLDIGHGAASFDFDVCKKAITRGYLPNTISTDLHIRNLNGPVFDLATTMNKLLACGMNLTEVIRSVTLHAANILREEDWCNFSKKAANNLTLFTVERMEDEEISKDVNGNNISIHKKIIPKAVINKGKLINLH
ncbi:amidohydrolase/deacetylase family metallohydrolase [Oceanobacillus jeddahense]|uniref:Amidohydrolase/deacetylase family metallohydrolase n=1 Tax=Oceanobacillus jeddahense TaxID=1462527 RepID=A0ABY5JPP9_9BACI|nr:amidohydrolase/deacetylase family metallohydrolase [Oceanobacillus jeddahense]UUI02265.1 amidohydrolase/deacetylase family metallohydrolase [Oceanobacillus jeddahense]